MIKGKTTIELTDVHTGEKKVIEDHNMVTHALQNFMNPLGIYGNYPYFGSSSNSVLTNEVWKIMTGGLFLFDGAIPEDVDMTFPPSDVYMVGNASIDLSNSGVVTELGSYNTTESGVQEDGSIKYVYDFCTQQANGTIKCACLTSKCGGIMGFGNLTSNAYDTTFGGFENESQYISATRIKIKDFFYHVNPSAIQFLSDDCVLFLDYEEDALYWLDQKSMNLSHSSYPEESNMHWSISKSIIMHKGYAHLKSIDINTDEEIKAFESNSYDVPTEILSFMGNSKNYARAYVDGSTTYIIFSKNSIISPGSFAYLMKIEKNGKVTAIKLNNNLSVNISIYQPAYPCIKNSKIYVESYSKNANGKYDIYEIDLDDNTQVNLISEYSNQEGFYNIDETSNLYNNYYYSNSKMYHGIVNITKKQASYTNGTTDGSNSPTFRDFSKLKKVLNSPNKMWIYASAEYICIVKDTRYLATINNLPEPVVKTADKTMKVTYTLSFS